MMNMTDPSQHADPEARLAEYVNVVPNEWRSHNDAADRIAEYLQQARQNRAALFGVINLLLQ